MAFASRPARCLAWLGNILCIVLTYPVEVRSVGGSGRCGERKRNTNNKYVIQLA